MSAPIEYLPTRGAVFARRQQPSQPVRSLTLSEIRELAGLTQAAMSHRMQVEQADISRIESRGDVRISTLSDYLKAAGGKLELFAKIGHDVVAIRIEETRGTKLKRKPREIPQPDQTTSKDIYLTTLDTK